MIITVETVSNFIKDYGTAIGVIVGPAIYFFKQWWSKRHDRKVLATAILAEIESVERRYQYSTGGGFRPELVFQIQRGQELFEWSVEQDYFTAYANNSSKIGLLKVDDVDAIVDLYTTANGFIDSIKQWNGAVQEYRRLLVSIVDDNNPALLTQFNEVLGRLPYWYLGILNEQAHLIAKIQLVKRLLKRY
jgi:hypothetical protein